MEKKTGFHFHNVSNEYAEVGAAKNSFETWRLATLTYFFFTAVALLFSEYLARLYLFPLLLTVVSGIICIIRFIKFKKEQEAYRTHFDNMRLHGKRRIGLVRKIDRYFDEGVFYFAVYQDDDKNLRHVRFGPFPESRELITYPKMVLDKNADLACILYEKNDQMAVEAIGYDRHLIEADIKALKMSRSSTRIRLSATIFGGILWFTFFYILDTISYDNAAASSFLEKIYSWFFDSREVLIFFGLLIFSWFGFVAGVLIDNRIHNKAHYLEETIKDIDWISDLKGLIDGDPDIERFPDDTVTVMEAMPPWARGERYMPEKTK